MMNLEKLLDEAKKHFAKDEEILNIARGRLTHKNKIKRGVLIATNKRVVFVEKN